MTSNLTEDDHTAKIQDILAKGGIECSLSTHVTLASEETEEEAQEAELGELEGEIKSELSEVIEEEIPVEVDEVIEEKGTVFPSPSLRKVLPDHVREYQQINSVHVLPEEFPTAIDPALIPKIASTAPRDYIDLLAELVGCTEYRSSMAEFWFLDTLANLLRRCQADGFDRVSQAVLMLWWCEFMKELQHFDAADRQRFLSRFQDNMLAAAAYVADYETLPTPAQAGVDYRAPPYAVGLVEEVTSSTGHAQVSAGAKHKSKLVTLDSPEYKCSLCRLTAIIHYFYDLFNTDYQYELVRSIFTFTPEYVVTNAPHALQVPKTLYTTVKPKGKKEAKPKKAKADPKKKDPGPPEYIALMQLKQREEEELLMLEQLNKEEWERKNHIQPLSAAIGEEFFNRYWPPGEASKKGDKKGKK